MKKGTYVFLIATIVLLSCTLSNPVALILTSATPTVTDTPTMTPTLTPTPFPPATATPTFTATPFQPTFGPPTDIAMTFDELYYYIESGHRGYVFDEICTEDQLAGPYITWTMVKEAVAVETAERQHPCLQLWADDISQIITPGGGYFPNDHRLVTVHENDVYNELCWIEGESLLHVFYEWTNDDPRTPNPFKNHPIMACGDGNGKPIGYGPGIQVFLDWLAAQPAMTIKQCRQKYPISVPGENA
jgi:hypothetical protein